MLKHSLHHDPELLRIPAFREQEGRVKPNCLYVVVAGSGEGAAEYYVRVSLRTLAVTDCQCPARYFDHSRTCKHMATARRYIRRVKSTFRDLRKARTFLLDQAGKGAVLAVPPRPSQDSERPAV